MRSFLLGFVLLAAAAARPLAAQGFTVVVHADNPAVALAKSEVSNIFLKRSARFASGRAALPVDQAKSATAREAFSKAVLGRSATAVVAYWQQQIFAGKDVPPAERPSDAEVIAFVKANPNAIGYVSAGATLGAGVKALAVK